MVEKKSGQGKPCPLFFNYMSVLLRKIWTMQVQVLLKIQKAKIAAKNTNNNPKQSGSETKPL